jgi:hypothetical protein
MSEEEIAPPSGFSIDPSTWVEPKQTFPGKIIVSAMRWSDEKYNQATEFRPALPRPVAQWDVRVQCLDRMYLLPDGSQAEVIRYGGIDLQKWSARDEAIVPIHAGFQKETLITGEWKRVFGTTEPPEILVGKFAEFEFYPAKRGARGRIMTNVLIPTAVLPPDFTFAGDVELIQVTREQQESRGTDAEATTEASTTPEAPAEEVAEQLVNFLVGQKADNAAAIIGALPDTLRTQSVLGGIASGDLLKELVDQKRITVGSDQVIAKV